MTPPPLLFIQITPWGRGASTSSESGKKIRRETLDNYMPETSAARYRKSQNSDGNATTLHAAPFEPRRVDSLGGLEREIPSPNSASVRIELLHICSYTTTSVRKSTVL